MAEKSKTKFKGLLVITVLMLLVILFFGLRGKGYHFTNDVTWIGDGPGIRFGEYGIAYAVMDDDRIKECMSRAERFSIELAVKSDIVKFKGFHILLSLHDGRDSDQLIIGQYQSYIVVMNSDDYPHIRKVKRIAADVFSKPPKKMLLTITTGREGTKLYLDGKMIKSRPDLILTIPVANTPRMTLGCTVHGNSPWRGELYGLAFYPRELDAATIKNRFGYWLHDQTLPYSGAEDAFLFFSFNERSGTGSMDQVTGVQKLNIPKNYEILEKRFLSPPWQNFKLNESFFMDFIINLLGFMPLGFFLCALLLESGGKLQEHAILGTATICFLISLGLEIAQAWIPSRDSQMLDLILNTTGAWIAAACYRHLFNMNGVFKTKKG